MAKRAASGEPVGTGSEMSDDESERGVSPAAPAVEPSLGDIFKYVKRTDTNVQKMKTSITKVEKTANEAKEEAQKAVEVAQQALKEVREYRSSAASTAGISTAGTVTHVHSKKAEHIPKSVEIKGYATFVHNRPTDDTCLTEPEAIAYIDQLKGALGDAGSKIDWEAAKSRCQKFPLMAKLVLPLLAETPDMRNSAWAARKAIADHFAQGRLKIQVNGVTKTPGVSVECSEERKPFRAAGARMMGFLMEHGVPKEKMKIDWEATPLRVVITKGARPQTLGLWSTSSGWTLLPDAVALLEPAQSVEQVKAAMM